MNFRKYTLLLVAIQLIAVTWFILSDGDTQRPDTERYLLLADQICKGAPYESPAERYRTGYFSPNDLVDQSYSGHENLSRNAPDIFRTPGYPVFLCALNKFGFDTDSEIVVAQLLVLYLCLFCFHFMAKRLYGAKISAYATLVLLASPGGLLYAMTLYSEVLFLFFLLVAVLAFLIYLKELNSRILILSGIFFAMAFYVRAGVVYMPFILSALTFLFLRQKLATKALHMTIFISVFIVSISPWVVRNYHHYGTFYISGQLSNTLAIWHLPDVREITKGATASASRALIRADVDKLVEQYEQDNKSYVNNVEFYNIQQQYAKDELFEDIPAYAERWAIGMWSTSSGGYLAELYGLFSDKPLHAKSKASEVVSHESSLVRLLAMTVQLPVETTMKILIKLERLFWISVILLALVPVLNGAFSLDVSALVILAVVSYFIFTPGTMGYSRFRFAIDWLTILQATIGANVLYQWFSRAYQQRRRA